MLQRSTIIDVARRAGVSIATVSRVINGTAKVSEETTQRVNAAIAELNYQPSSIARGLASQKTKTIGLLTNEISVPFFGPILRGIEAVASEFGFGLLINCTQGKPSSGPGYHRRLGPHNTDGLLVFAGTLADEELAYLYHLGFPVVLLHQSPPPGLKIPSITFENKGGARRLVDHLIEVHGYRRIAFLRGPENHEDSHWRETGYREALRAHGIPFDPELVAIGDFSQEIACRATGSWLRNGIQFEAIFAGDDEGAFGAITALQKAGQRVPEDVAVVGFDDVHLAHYLFPALTTVKAPVEQAGREAARQLICLLQRESAEPLILLPTELVVRRSCGCLAGREEGSDQPTN